MKRILLSLCLAVTIIVISAVTIFADKNNLSIVIDGQEVQFSQEYGYPYIDENERTQVPLRIVMEQYGCSIEWDDVNKIAIVTKDKTTVSIPIGENYILVNGKTSSIDTSAVIKNDRTYLPIRAVLEAFGAKVEWEEGKVTVTSPAEESTINLEDIHIDDNGDLIVSLKNGQIINAGHVTGSSGTDGASVTGAEINDDGHLIITLSNNKVIDAGNAMQSTQNSTSFENYPVGTKFYLQNPSGKFSVNVIVDGVVQKVEFSEIYYELTAKNDINSDDAWNYSSDLSYISSTRYEPYEVTMHIEGSVDKSLEGKYVIVALKQTDSGAYWHYDTKIPSSGVISIEQVYKSSSQWLSVKDLCLLSVSISNTLNYEPWDIL